jgi:hypothetical protein
MLPYHFVGAVHFVEKAAAEMGRPVLAGAVRRLGALSSLAGLCAQAVHAETSQAVRILAEAAAYRDQLHTAARAADLILDDVRAGLGLGASEPESAPDDADADADAQAPAPPIKTGRASRRPT